MDTIKILKTPRGTFNVKAIFENESEANKNDFYYYFTFEGNDIYTKHISLYSVYFAIIEKKYKEV